MAYATTSDLKAYLGLTGTADDALLLSCMQRAQSMVDTHCDQVFEASADTTRYFDAVEDVADAVLHLDYPLAAITSITNGDGVAVATTEYVTEPRNRTPYHRIRLLGSKNKYWDTTSSGDPENAITIVGKWAYSTSAPPAIVQACVRLAAYMYRQKDSQVFDVTADPASGQLIIPKGLPPDVKQMLMPYRRLS